MTFKNRERKKNMNSFKLKLPFKEGRKPPVVPNHGKYLLEKKH